MNLIYNETVLRDSIYCSTFGMYGEYSFVWIKKMSFRQKVKKGYGTACLREIFYQKNIL